MALDPIDIQARWHAREHRISPEWKFLAGVVLGLSTRFSWERLDGRYRGEVTVMLQAATDLTCAHAFDGRP
ncbi:MAG: hypothetical protein JJ863_00270 [Deltaproteobacteria bacterium]|nr:hypothetical protein [Deltaproteobacteria bacterium]